MAEIRVWWSRIVAHGFARLLLQQGFTLRVSPGEAIRLERGDQSVAIEDEIAQRIDGHIADAVWRVRCQKLGIAGRKLAG